MAMFDMTGYVPVPIHVDDYIALLPTVVRSIQTDGIQATYRPGRGGDGPLAVVAVAHHQAVPVLIELVGVGGDGRRLGSGHLLGVGVGVLLEANFLCFGRGVEADVAPGFGPLVVLLSQGCSR